MVVCCLNPTCHYYINLLSSFIYVHNNLQYCVLHLPTCIFHSYTRTLISSMLMTVLMLYNSAKLLFVYSMYMMYMYRSWCYLCLVVKKCINLLRWLSIKWRIVTTCQFVWSLVINISVPWLPLIYKHAMIIECQPYYSNQRKKIISLANCIVTPNMKHLPIMSLLRFHTFSLLSDISQPGVKNKNSLLCNMYNTWYLSWLSLWSFPGYQVIAAFPLATAESFWSHAICFVQGVRLLNLNANIPNQDI